jgi:hypothetical protein
MRPADAFAPDGWAGFVPSGPARPYWAKGQGSRRALPARPSPGPGSGAGLATRQAAPPSRDRPGHRRPPSTPGPDRGSREGDGGIMREVVRCGISRGGEKCGSEGNQGVGGRRGRILSTPGEPREAIPLIRLGAFAPIHLLPQGEKGSHASTVPPISDICALQNSPEPRALPSPLVGEGGRAQRGRMRGTPAPPPAMRHSGMDSRVALRLALAPE